MFRLLLARVYQEMTNSKRPEPLEICWRLLEGSSTRILICSMFASDSGVELRVGYVAHFPLYSQTVVDIESARGLAQKWLDAVRARANANSQVAMPQCTCTTCQQPGRLLESASADSLVNYYRCDRCGHVWAHDKRSPDDSRRDITRPPSAPKIA